MPSPASERILPLSDFQRLMKFWNDAHPFSGIDAIEVRGTVDVTALRAAADEELAILGVGFPIAAGDGASVHYRPNCPPVVAEIVRPSAGMAPQATLTEHCMAELNRSFRPDAEPFLRLWVIDKAPLGYIGMTWQHWPVDGVSAADLFRRILARFAGSPLTDVITATERIATDPATLFSCWQTWRRKFYELVVAVKELFGLSRIFVVPRPARTAYRVRLLDLPHPPRPPGATVNDVIAAALMWSLNDVLRVRGGHLWQRRINLLNFVDLRPYGGEKLQRAWGCFLGYFSLFMPEPRPERMDELIESLRVQSTFSRENEVFSASLGGFAMLRVVWSFLPRRWRLPLTHRLCPFTAALTNTRFRGDWNAEPLRSRFGRSWRIAPGSPMAPLVADVCTKGDQLSLALTCEDGGLISNNLERIAETLQDVLGQNSKRATVVRKDRLESPRTPAR